MVLIFFGCSKEEETTPAKIYSDDIVGEWDWVESWSPWGGGWTPSSCTCWASLTFTSDSVFSYSDQQINPSRRKYRLIRTYDVISKDSVDGIIYNSNVTAFVAYRIKQDTLITWTINATDGGWSEHVRK